MLRPRIDDRVGPPEGQFGRPGWWGRWSYRGSVREDSKDRALAAGCVQVHHERAKDAGVEIGGFQGCVMPSS